MEIHNLNFEFVGFSIVCRRYKYNTIPTNSMRPFLLSFDGEMFFPWSFWIIWRAFGSIPCCSPLKIFAEFPKKAFKSFSIWFASLVWSSCWIYVQLPEIRDEKNSLWAPLSTQCLNQANQHLKWIYNSWWMGWVIS